MTVGDFYLYYSGVGSRNTPHFVCQAMTDLASILEVDGYILRSGGARGADSAFEEGVKYPENKRIYLSKKGARGHTSALYGVCDEAKAIALDIHPRPDILRQQEYILLLHARNCYQVLGDDLKTPSEFMLCWTEDAAKKGGTRTAIVLAERNNIPVLNFGKCQSRLDCLKAFERFSIMYL